MFLIEYVVVCGVIIVKDGEGLVDCLYFEWLDYV